MKKFLAILMMLLLCTSTVALAAQKVTMLGDTYLRTGAGKGYAIKTAISKGEKATYLDHYKKDSRGVYWLKVKYDGKTGWVSTRYAKLGHNSSKVVKTTASVNVRIAPNKNSQILGSVGKNTEFVYRGKSVTDSRGIKWYQVSYSGQNGWVSSKYAKLQ